MSTRLASDWLGDRAFRALLRAYPATFRQVYAEPMLEAFREQRREPEYAGLAGSARFWLEIARDTLVGAARRQRHQHGSPAGRAPREPRDLTGRREMETIWRDIAYASRQFARKPMLTATAVITLGLGIGANTAIFSVVEALLYRPLAGARADGLVVIGSLREDFPYPIDVSFPDYREFRALDVFDGATAFAFDRARLNAEGLTPQRVMIMYTTDNYFSLLGVDAGLGRTYRPDEVTAAPPGDVVVLSHSFWVSRLAADPAAVGRTLRLNDHSFTVIGVTRPDFQGTAGVLELDMYLPIGAEYRVNPRRDGRREERDASSYRVIARMRPGVEIGQAKAVVLAAAERIAQEYPETNGSFRATVFPEPATRLEMSAALYLPQVASVFMIMVGLVLLIACANVANLLLAQALGRRKELAVRTALGAGQWRIARQMLTESVLLGLLGAGVGWGLTLWATDIISALRIATDVPLRIDVRPSATVFYFAVVTALLTGVIAGLVPSLHVARANLHDALKEGGRGSSGGRQRLRSALVVSQVAVSLVLLVSAGLFVRSMSNFGTMDLGFETENRAFFTVDTTLGGYDDERSEIFFRDLMDRLRELPGVASASRSLWVPIGVNQRIAEVFREDEVADSDGGTILSMNRVGLDYFETMGTPLLRGRDFREDDRGDEPRVAVVNDVMAERFWPDEEALGRHVRLGAADGPLVEVVGVARVATYNLPGETPPPMIYLAMGERHESVQVVHLHAERDASALLARAVEDVRALDPEMPVFDARTMDTHIREGKGALLTRLGGGLVGAFGIIGLVLAAVGLYGVIAYWVGQRSEEIGIRMALGADAPRILVHVLRHGLILTSIGVAIGLLGASVLTGSFSNLLVGVSARDPLTFTVISVGLIVVALLAAYFPARRATRVDPMRALRSE